MTICFFEIAVQGRFFGWITFELFDNDAPKAATNFRLLCTGELTNKKGKQLHYKGTRLYRIIPQFVIQGGDVMFDDGSGGESVLDSPFFDEISPIKHNCAGLLCCANMGRPGTNASQFYITLCPCPWLDGRDTVFGRILSGHKCAAALESFGTSSGSVNANIVISDCGTLIDPAALPGAGSMTGLFGNNPFRMSELHPHVLQSSKQQQKNRITRAATGRIRDIPSLSINEETETENEEEIIIDREISVENFENKKEINNKDEDDSSVSESDIVIS